MMLNSMEATGEKKGGRSYFAYTQGKFWGGANADYVILALLACFPLTGLFGLDHLYMRSPLTALLKTVLNVLSLGLWYFYDVAQVLTESATVKEIGYSVPLFGPIGLGAGLFAKEGEATVGPNPLRFLAYVAAALLPLPFGQDFFVAGDTWGGIMKLVTLFVPIFWLFGLLWFLYVAFRIFFQTESLLTEGIPRFFPFTLFMDNYYCSRGTLGPDRPCSEAAPTKGLLMSLLSMIQGIPIVGRIVDPIVATAQVAKQTTEIVVNQTLKPSIQFVQAAASTGAKVLETVPAAAQSALDEVGKLTDPNALLAQALDTKAQTGGSRTQEPLTGALLLFIVGAAVSGWVAARIRKSQYINLLPEAFQTIVHTPARGPSDVPPLPRTTA